MMKSIKNKDDFRKFMEENRDKIYAIAEDANDIKPDDEWMQEDIWDEIFENEVY